MCLVDLSDSGFVEMVAICFCGLYCIDKYVYPNNTASARIVRLTALKFSSKMQEDRKESPEPSRSQPCASNGDWCLAQLETRHTVEVNNKRMLISALALSFSGLGCLISNITYSWSRVRIVKFLEW